MPENELNRFVSRGFQGVALIEGDRQGEPLLAGRSARAGQGRQKNTSSKRDFSKSDLISAVAESSSLSRAGSSKVVEQILETISNALRNGQDVKLVGFGTFSISKHGGSSGRISRPIKTDGAKSSPQPTFTAGKNLKNAVK